MLLLAPDHTTLDVLDVRERDTQTSVWNAICALLLTNVLTETREEGRGCKERVSSATTTLPHQGGCETGERKGKGKERRTRRRRVDQEGQWVDTMHGNGPLLPGGGSSRKGRGRGKRRRVGGAESGEKCLFMCFIGDTRSLSTPLSSTHMSPTFTPLSGWRPPLLFTLASSHCV